MQSVSRNKKGKKRGRAPVVQVDAPPSDDEDTPSTMPASMSQYVKDVAHATQNGKPFPRALLALGSLMAARGSDPTAMVGGMSSMGHIIGAADAVFKMQPRPPKDRGGLEGVLTAISRAVQSTPAPVGVDADAVREASTIVMTYEETAACLATPLPRFNVGGREVVAPPCSSGDACVTKEAKIPGLSSTMGVELMAYMTGPEFQVLRRTGSLPLGIQERKCILCMRVIQLHVLLTVESTNAMTQLNVAAAGSRVVVCSIVNRTGPGQYKPSVCLSPLTFTALNGSYVVAPGFGMLRVSRESPLLAPWKNCINMSSLLWIREDALREPVDGRSEDMLPATDAIPDPGTEARKAGSKQAAWAPLGQYASVVGARHATEADPGTDPLRVVTAGVPSTAVPAGHPSNTVAADDAVPEFGAAVARSAAPYAGGGPPASVIRGKTVAALAKEAGMTLTADGGNAKPVESFEFNGKTDRKVPRNGVKPWKGIAAGRAVPTDDDSDDSDASGLIVGDEDGDYVPPEPKTIPTGAAANRRRLRGKMPVAPGTVIGVAATATASDF